MPGQDSASGFCVNNDVLVPPRDAEQLSRRHPPLLLHCLVCILSPKSSLSQIAVHTHLHLTSSASVCHCVTCIVSQLIGSVTECSCATADDSTIPFSSNWIQVSDDHFCPVSSWRSFSHDKDKIISHSSNYSCTVTPMTSVHLWCVVSVMETRRDSVWQHIPSHKELEL